MVLTRRRFAGLAGGALGVAVLPKALAQGATGRKIRYAAVGLGEISAHHFMPACRSSATCEITGLVSGHPEKARRLAAEYGVPERSIYSYETYDKMRDNAEIDAVYIGLPNGMHAEYTIRAAQAGKHVLCEKPMANTPAECEAMIAACAKADRKLMVAYRCQLEPVVLKAREMVQSGKLGKIEAVEGAFGFNSPRGVWRLDGKLGGGGPLMDVGIYPLNTSRFLLGEEPAHIAATSSVIDQDGRFAQVEENLSWTMRFPSGATGSFSTTYGAEMDGYLRVYGSKGWLEIRPAYSYVGTRVAGHLNGVAKGDAGVKIDELMQGQDPVQFQDEAEYFAKCIRSGAAVGPSGEEGLRDMRLIAEIYRAAGLRS